MEGWGTRDSQEAEDVELIHVFDTGRGKGEDRPSHLEKGDVQRNVDLRFVSTSLRSILSRGKAEETYSGKQQIGRNLPKHIGRTPNGVGVVELISVEPEIFFHATVCKTLPS